MRAPPPRTDRGSTLLVVMVLLVVLTMLAMSLIKRNTDEADAVAAKRRYDQAVSCADGAREMLAGQLRVFGVIPTDIRMDNVVGSQHYATGHYDSFAVTSIQVATGTQAGTVGVTDIANRTQASRLGGQTYRITAVCYSGGADAATQQDEVEFLVRFGL